MLLKNSVGRSLFMAGALVSAAVIGLASTARPAAAQQFIGFQNGEPFCNGPLGVAPCVVIQNWIAAHQFQPQVMPVPAPPPVSNAGGGGSNNPLQQFGNAVQQIAPVIGVAAALLGG